MKTYALSRLELRKVGIFFKDTAEKNFQNKTRVELRTILGTLRTGSIPDILPKLNGLTVELNKFYK